MRKLRELHRCSHIPENNQHVEANGFKQAGARIRHLHDERHENAHLLTVKS